MSKRPQNYRRFLPPEWLKNPRPNVWLLTTVESQQYMWRAVELLRVPAVVHGLSIEPLLGQVDLTGVSGDGSKVDWVIIGGESGGGSRPFRLDHARRIVNDCRAAGIAVFVKQMGRLPVFDGNGELWPLQINKRHGANISEFPDELKIQQFPNACI